jgi:hypothetical protein
MDQFVTQAASQEAASIPRPVAGVIAGLAAGTAYLAAQVAFTASAEPGGAAEPLQRIAAILLGPDAAPPPADFDFTILGMALIIHFALAIVYGRIICTLVWQLRPGPGVLVGALAGTALYVLNFGFIAPHAFPWFNESIRAVTLADHILFGAVCSAVVLALRRRVH